MRKHYSYALKGVFCERIIHVREELKISQEEMAHRLAMASRTYIDLEHGKNCCSAVTLVLFLLYFCPDPTEFLAEVRAALEKADEVA